MKKNKFFIGAFALIIVAIAGINVSWNTGHESVSTVKLANIKALSSEGVEQCSIFDYNRNYMEEWKPVYVSAAIGVGGPQIFLLTLKNN
ncbi:hypothetical protein FACS189430_07170 [Bacteroidia bacterium]|nr:hypothetical protein FACS189430_07170 [Bacteroidia bacterium]